MSDSFSFEAYSEAFANNPYSVYASMREKHPVYYHARWDAWLFSSYEDIKKLVTDKRLGRTMDHVLAEQEILDYREKQNWQAAPMHSKYVKVSILDSEGELHNHLRKAVFRAFTSTQIKRLEGFVAEQVDRQLAGLDSTKEVDFIEDVVAPIPGLVIGELLGVPAQDRPQLRIWSENIVQFFEPERTDAHRQLAEAATIEFVSYLDQLIRLRQKKPQDDLISSMIAWRDGDESLSQDELISTAMTILMAGHGSTIDASGNGMLALLQHPEQLAKLRAQPELIQAAVQEMFRFDPPLPYFHRYVLEDMTYKEYHFEKGTTLGFLYAAANRDPAQFDDPDYFDIQRKPNRHMAFGGGIHFCLGNHLSRLNMEIMFTSLLQRFPEIRLAVAPEELRWHGGILSRGLVKLPLLLSS